MPEVAPTVEATEKLVVVDVTDAVSVDGKTPGAGEFSMPAIMLGIACADRVIDTGLGSPGMVIEKVAWAKAETVKSENAIRVFILVHQII
jgi:hypothetical protein